MTATANANEYHSTDKNCIAISKFTDTCSQKEFRLARIKNKLKNSKRKKTIKMESRFKEKTTEKKRRGIRRRVKNKLNEKEKKTYHLGRH